MSRLVPAHAEAADTVEIEQPPVGGGLEIEEDETTITLPNNSSKKKKKKKPKKAKALELVPTSPTVAQEPKQQVLCISRNKHWRYISSYHGPWLQLPLELLESLLTLNLDPNNFSPKDDRIPAQSKSRRATTTESTSSSALTLRSQPHNNNASTKPIPPPIDPTVFKSVASIRRLIDEASDLAVRAASGLSASSLGALRSPTSSNNPWATAHALGMNPLGDHTSGRTPAMSSTRTHRLRVLAVQKLAAAYQADEIAASVMVMQGASALDDLAERVLKVDPNDLDARYVHFFHEKIPSRQLADYTTTEVLDGLIESQPSRLQYYRTRGIVRCFRDEYTIAVKDFTHILRESRALRKAKAAHHSDDTRRTKPKGKKYKENKVNGQAPPNGTSAPDPGAPDEPAALKAPLHPSVGPDAPEALEMQALFLRGAAYLQHAVLLIEKAVLEVEGLEKIPAQDALELKLFLLEKGRYGGMTGEGPDGPLGPKMGEKMRAYRRVLATPDLQEVVGTLLRKSIRDHEKFMAYFDTVDGLLPYFQGNLAQRVECAFLLSESLRPGSHAPPPPLPENPGIFTTYHPLLVESQYSVLLSHMILGDFVSVLSTYQRAAALVDGLEGYPIFLPARSMAQAEFVEIMERLASGWAPGTQPHSLSQQSKMLMIEGLSTPPSIEGSSASIETQDSADSTRTASPTTEEEGTQSSTDPNNAPPSRSLSLVVTSTNGTNGHANGFRQQLSATESLTDSPIVGGIAIQNKALNLDCLRILLAPVANRQRIRSEKEAEAAAKEKATGKKKGLSINIPLHGPRVDIALAYIAAVHLPELDP